MDGSILSLQICLTEIICHHGHMGLGWENPLLHQLRTKVTSAGQGWSMCHDPLLCTLQLTSVCLTKESSGQDTIADLISTSSITEASRWMGAWQPSWAGDALPLKAGS